MRTLSKAWGLAGVRLGFCFAAQNIIAYMMKVKAPYNINALTGAAAFTALGNVRFMQTTLDRILDERRWLAGQIAVLPRVRKVYPSDANFLLVRCTGAADIYSALAEKNIIVRNRSTEPLLDNCLRITVGTHEENEALVNTWKEIIG
jgi:histidinol-phosphate aminotransferase